MLKRRLGECNILEISRFGLTLAKVQNAVRYDHTMPWGGLTLQLLDDVWPVPGKTDVKRPTKHHQRPDQQLR
eukprot:7487665-Alexandrium_andersonii.AAC.1